VKKLSTRLYERLTPEERFKLALEAMARDDEQEMRRLAESYPKKTYTMRDADFIDLLEASRYLAFGFSLLWLDAYSRYLVLEAAAKAYFDALSFFTWGYVLGANNAWRRAGKEGVLFDVEGREPTDAELREIGLAVAIENFPKEAEKILRAKAASLRALWQGFAAFCREKSLDPEVMLNWWPPVLDQMRRERELLEAPAPAEEAEAAREAFAAVWERVAG
jgi:hypothetical protein